MANATPVKLSRRERIQVELREFAILATYLFICFSALAGFKAAILSSEGISFAPWLFALIKALVCAKLLLVGRWFGLGDGLAAKGLLLLLGEPTEIAVERLSIGKLGSHGLLHAVGAGH